MTVVNWLWIFATSIVSVVVYHVRSTRKQLFNTLSWRCYVDLLSESFSDTFRILLHETIGLSKHHAVVEDLACLLMSALRTCMDGGG